MTAAPAPAAPRRGVPPAFWIGVILALAVLARCLFPQADPPLRMGGSGGLFSDEGTYTTDARNFILFGKAFLDEWSSYEYSPVLHAIQLPVFGLFGVGLLQERLIPMAFGIATVLLLYLFAARAWGREAGGYAAFFLATSYFAVVHSRLGLVETPQTFIMVLTLLLWQRARGRPGVFAAAAGGTAALVVITKSLGLWFVAAFYAAALLEVLLAPAEERKAALRRLGAALLASGAVMLVWYLLFYLPNRESLLRFGAAYKKLSVPNSTAKLLQNLKKLWFLYYYRPEWVALGLSFLAAAALLLRPGRREMEPRLDAWRMLLWLLAGVLALGALSYNPPRYFVPLMPAIAALAGWGLATFRRAPERGLPLPAPLGFAAVWVWLTLVVRFLPVQAIAQRWSLGPFSQGRLHWVLSAGAAAAALAFVFGGRRFLAGRQARGGPALRAALVALVLLASLGQNARQYAAWVKNRRYTVLETSRELAPVVNGGLVAGLFAPVLSLENKARVLYALEPWCNYERTFERFPITHFLLGDSYREPAWWWRRYPEQMRRAVPLRVYRIWLTNIYFLSLREEDRGIFNRLRMDRGGALDATLVERAAPRELPAGAAGAGRITFRNSGSSPWAAGGVSLAVWRGRTLGPATVPLPPGTIVRPGESVTLEVPYQAPANTGYFMTEWRLREESGGFFGDSAPEGILVLGPRGEI